MISVNCNSELWNNLDILAFDWKRERRVGSICDWCCIKFCCWVIGRMK
jgi:hypothetical protein